MKKFADIKKGSQGTDVYIMQAMLRALQYCGKDGKPIDVDGYCGDNTVSAIQSFEAHQRAFGVEVSSVKGKNDGVFGQKCWKRLLGF